MECYEKIAQILRADKNGIRFIEERLGDLTGKKGVMKKIVEQNRRAMNDRLNILGLAPGASAKEIYDALINKMQNDDRILFAALGKPSANKSKDWQKVLEAAKNLANSQKGFFLKKEKARELLRNQPPLKIMKFLGYSNVEDLLAKENIFEIFSALRFIEGSEWLNKVFFKQYKNLKPSDFEEREITALALPEKWAKSAEEFIKKKYHNISHLKELGVIYVIPLALKISGETLRNFALILHYFNEVLFYSDLFRRLSSDKKKFSANLISLLRGDISEHRVSFGKCRWLVIQRYLAKDDENDRRLFEPHLNPEAIHWEKAEKLLIKAGEVLNGFSSDIGFWEDLNWVGDYFKSDAGIDVLVSFNLIDASMSLVKEKEMIKYLYHHQEALWNKIFMEYFGEEATLETIKQNIIKGWVEI